MAGGGRGGGGGIHFQLSNLSVLDCDLTLTLSSNLHSPSLAVKVKSLQGAAVLKY